MADKQLAACKTPCVSYTAHTLVCTLFTKTNPLSCSWMSLKYIKLLWKFLNAYSQFQKTYLSANTKYSQIGAGPRPYFEYLWWTKFLKRVEMGISKDARHLKPLWEANKPTMDAFPISEPLSIKSKHP